MKQALLQELLQARQDKRSCALLTWLNDGHSQIVFADQPASYLPFELIEKIQQAMQEDRSGVLETSDGPIFVQVFHPPLRLLIVGAVHIAQALVPLARLTGYQVTLIDPRQAWVSQARFSELEITTDWPDLALQDLTLDVRTAVVTLSHDPKLDDPALRVALRSPVFYIGALGSRKTHAARLGRLTEDGFSQAELERIHAPIGLNIGAHSPSEIALSIMAEITQVLRQGGGV